jgi:hypothetical protein
MADAKKCDICGKFYIPPLGSALETGWYLSYNNAFGLGNQCDLCPDCKSELGDFVRSMKEKKQDDRND